MIAAVGLGRAFQRMDVVFDGRGPHRTNYYDLFPYVRRLLIPALCLAGRLLGCCAPRGSAGPLTGHSRLWTSLEPRLEGPAFTTGVDTSFMKPDQTARGDGSGVAGGNWNSATAIGAVFSSMRGSAMDRRRWPIYFALRSQAPFLRTWLRNAAHALAGDVDGRHCHLSRACLRGASHQGSSTAVLERYSWSLSSASCSSYYRPQPSGSVDSGLVAGIPMLTLLLMHTRSYGKQAERSLPRNDRLYPSGVLRICRQFLRPFEHGGRLRGRRLASLVYEGLQVFGRCSNSVHT